MQSPSTPANKEVTHQVMVLGMHRSGTSAVAGALCAMGLYAGRESELMDKTQDNPLGYFERKDVYLLTSAIFRDNGADWWKVSQFDPERLPSEAQDRYHPRIRKLIDALDGDGGWLLKDPRLCVLFPLFRPFLREPLVVLAARHPVEVAKSLRKRDNIPLHAGIALWELYVRKACQYAKRERYLVVPHTELMADPERIIGRMAQWMEKQGLVGLDVDSGVQWVDRSLHHQTLDEEEERVLMNDDQRHLWRLLSSSSLDEVDGEISESTLQVLKDFEADFSDQRRLQRTVSDLNGQIKSLEEQVQTQAQEAGILGAALGDCLETIWKAGQPRNARNSTEHGWQKVDDVDNNLPAKARGDRPAPNDGEWRPDLSELDWHNPVLVSVVAHLNNLNAADVASCVDCLKNQSWPLWELIFAGNPEQHAERFGSIPDGDARIVLEESRETDHWKTINHALCRARGRVVTVWNKDCAWHRDFLVSSVMAFQHRPGHVAFVGCGAASGTPSTTPLPNPVRWVPPIWGMVWCKALLTDVGELRSGSEAMVVADWLLRAAGGQPLELDSRLLAGGDGAIGHEVTEEWWLKNLSKLSNSAEKMA